MKKTIISTMITLSFVGLANASEKTSDLKSSATMQATCSISANQIGFGAVAAPLLAQTAQSEMNVKCSNSTAYTIDLAYGGIYGQGSTDSGYKISFYYQDQNYTGYDVFNVNGYSQGMISCGRGLYSGKVSFTSQTVASIYSTTQGYSWQNDTTKACTNNLPTGWTGAYNTPGLQSVGGPGYAYGVMNGMSKGDKLAYSIQVPGDSTKVWNKGSNSYKSTGNGDNQTIPLVAKIVPDKSGSKYPAPDMYLDTVTAVISY